MTLAENLADYFKKDYYTHVTHRTLKREAGNKMGQKPKIAIFGGGTGLSVLLRA